jgi:hypothetical protein
MKLFVITMSLMLAASAFAAEVDISEGQLTYIDPYYVHRFVAAKNNTGPLESLRIECGFFRGTALLGVATGFAENIEAGQTVYVDVMASNVRGADRTDCRVVHIRPK